MITALRARRASRQSLPQLLQLQLHLLQGQVNAKEQLQQAENAKLLGPQSPSQQRLPGESAHLWAGARYSKQVTRSPRWQLAVAVSLPTCHHAKHGFDASCNAACTASGAFW